MSEDEAKSGDITEQQGSPSNETDDLSDLDALLAEYDQSAQTEDKSTSGAGGETKSNGDDTDRLARLERQLAQDRKEREDDRRRRAEEDARKGVYESVAYIRKKEGLELSDMMIEGYLQAMAARRPNLLNAFAQRHQDPEAYNRVLDAVAKEIAKDAAKVPDTKLTDDAEAVRAAVRGQGESPQRESKEKSPSELRGMSDRDFKAYKAELDAQNS